MVNSVLEETQLGTSLGGGACGGDGGSGGDFPVFVRSIFLCRNCIGGQQHLQQFHVVFCGPALFVAVLSLSQFFGIVLAILPRSLTSSYSLALSAILCAIQYPLNNLLFNQPKPASVVW